MKKQIGEFWHDARTANPKTLKLRKGQAAALFALAWLVACLVAWLDGETKRAGLFFVMGGMFASVSLLSFLLHGLERFRQKRIWRKFKNQNRL